MLSLPFPCEHRFFCVALVPERNEQGQSSRLESCPGLHQLARSHLFLCLCRTVCSTGGGAQHTNTPEGKDTVCALTYVPAYITCSISYNQLLHIQKLIRRAGKREGNCQRGARAERMADEWERRADADSGQRVVLRYYSL